MPQESLFSIRQQKSRQQQLLWCGQFLHICTCWRPCTSLPICCTLTVESHSSVLRQHRPEHHPLYSTSRMPLQPASLFSLHKPSSTRCFA